MSLHVGGIYVLTGDQSRVVRVTKAFWARQGGKPAPAEDDVLEYESLGLEDTGKLGYAVCPPTADDSGRTWVAVYDSEQYTASEELAQELALQLDTEVIHYGFTGSVDQASMRVFSGPSVTDTHHHDSEAWDEVEGAIATMPHPMLYYSEIQELDEDERAGFVIFGFVGIPEREDGYSGPSQEALQRQALLSRFTEAVERGDHLNAWVIQEENQELADELVQALDEVAPEPQSASRSAASLRVMHTVVALAKVIRANGLDSALQKLAVAAYLTRSMDVFDQVSQVLGEKIVALEITAVNDLGQKRYAEAVDLLRRIVKATDKSLTAYNNLAHGLQYVEPIPGDAAELLALCDAIGPRNPNIFHNSACAWVRIGQHAKALEAIRNAARHGYDKLASMRTDADLAPLFDLPDFAAAFEVKMDLTQWNLEGRKKNAAVCKAFETIIDEDGSSDEDFAEDERSEALANAVLARVVALNAAGEWRKARTELDPAHGPFIPHMNETGLRAVVILGADRFLVRRGDEVLHLNGDAVEVLEGVSAFAISRDRRWLVLAKAEGLIVTRGLGGEPRKTIPWPEGVTVDPSSVETLDVANDGTSVVLASDVIGIWLLQLAVWTQLAPRPGVGDATDEDEDEDDDDDDEEEEEEEDEDEDEGGEADDDGGDDADNCGIKVGTYAELRAAMVGAIGIDRTHAAISPDGKLVAYGWQDSMEGHYVDRVAGGVLEPLGTIAARSDYPYLVKFTDDARRVLSNSRHMENGITLARDVASLGSDDDDESPATDEFLRAYGIALMPGELFGLQEPVAWIGGAGWSHASALSGGKPVFTQLLGSALHAFDYDPVSKRVAVASASGMLHVLDPTTEAELGRERGYHPRRELYRWIFWDALAAPIRW